MERHCRKCSTLLPVTRYFYCKPGSGGRGKQKRGGCAPTKEVEFSREERRQLANYSVGTKELYALSSTKEWADTMYWDNEDFKDILK